MNECGTIELLLGDLATSSLTPEELRAVELHLAGCSACARTAAGMGKLLARRPVPEAVPDAYWTGVLPRVRSRIDARRSFELPFFVAQRVLPALAALFLIVVGAELVPVKPGSAPGDAAMLLTSLPESDLASVAERHDLEAPIMLPADVAESASLELEEGAVLQEIVDAETTVNLYAYVDPDVAAGNLAEEDQATLISMIDHE